MLSYNWNCVHLTVIQTAEIINQLIRTNNRETRRTEFLFFFFSIVVTFAEWSCGICYEFVSVCIVSLFIRSFSRCTSRTASTNIFGASSQCTETPKLKTLSFEYRWKRVTICNYSVAEKNWVVSFPLIFPIFIVVARSLLHICIFQSFHFRDAKWQETRLVKSSNYVLAITRHLTASVMQRQGYKRFVILLYHFVLFHIVLCNQKHSVGSARMYLD